MMQPCPNCAISNDPRCSVCFGAKEIPKPVWHNATHEKLFRSLIPGYKVATEKE